jgi:plastocyanin
MARRVLALASLGLLLIGTIAAPAVVEAGGGCHGDGNGGSVYLEGDGTTVIRMDVCSFAPTISRVQVGTTVRFLNTATIDHAVVGRLATWGSDVLSPGREYSQKFDTAGTYPYTCPLHPGMVGAIVVGDPSAVVAATEPAETESDPTPVALVGFAGLGLGTALGLAVGILRRRRRTTA